MFLYEKLLKLLVEAGDKGCYSSVILKSLDTTASKLKSQLAKLNKMGFNYRYTKEPNCCGFVTYYISIDDITMEKAKKLLEYRDKTANEAIEAIVSNKGMTGDEIKKMFNIKDRANLRCLFTSIRDKGFNVKNLKPYSNTGFYAIGDDIDRYYSKKPRKNNVIRKPVSESCNLNVRCKPVRNSDSVYFMSEFDNIQENYRFIPEQNELIEKVFR